MAFHSIIPAGGIGSRLWPLSRADQPKFLTDFTGSGASMLQETVARLKKVTDTCTIVTGEKYAEAVESLFPSMCVLAEPSPRGTMPAIALAAGIISYQDPQAIVGSFAADHYIRDEQAFSQAVACAVEAARAGYIATIGIQPDSPSTAYGYIKRDEELEVPGAYLATDFVEKPDAELAQQYVDSGHYFWNAGIFIAKASVLLERLEALRPDIAQPISEIAGAWGSPDYEETLARLWPTIPDTVIDRVIAEPCASEGRVAVVPASMGWSDIGDFDSLAEIVDGADTQENVLAIDSPDSLVLGADKPVVLLGIEGAVVVETPEALLVTRRDCAQDVKKIVERLPEHLL
ncbi:MAG: mannose-1-phosphate guanylyltransferase [Actinomycetaceae bacterium]|nr:mannose-1-phosphate guanylyltransferase [Actinomycetaceae bacterium]